jgi:L-lactate dehydrogenase complex protein LldG
MGATHIDQFRESVRDVGGELTRIPAEKLPATLESVIREPAVGTPLPFDGVSYGDTSVETPPTGADLTRAATGVTAGRLGIVDYGSVVLEETGHGEELLGLYPGLHVVVVAASDVVPGMPEAFGKLDAGFGDGADAVIATGPSATADMGAVVTGVHGPRDVHVVVLEDR